MIRQDRIYFGGDYNPEQWDEATIEQDMKLFEQAHVNMVVLPVFGWAKLEPQEGVYDFEWLDRILDKLWSHGIRVCMATPTTAQPAWMSHKYPEVLPVDIQGRRRTHGMRVFFCHNSLKYRERAAAIAEAMASRYQNHPALAGWHIANEYGTYCYCPNCRAKFREWLRKRYKTPQGLNEAWNLAFWGRQITDFEEMELPSELNDDYRFYPPIQQDYLKFTTDSVIECFENEYQILKKYTPDLPVMTNMSGYIKKLDQFELCKHLDIVGWDNYPAPFEDPSLPALKHDIMRGLKQGQSYWVTEQSPNQQNWQPYNVLKRPGEIRRLAYQGLAHGADTALFFQMRQSQAGQEKFHGALISHEGSGNTRIFREMTQIGRELQGMGDLSVGARTAAKVGLIMDWHNWWAVELSSGPSRDLQYLPQVQKYYKAFYKRNIAVDILRYDQNLEAYDVILTPCLYQMRGDLAQRLEEYVRHGGTLVASVFSGIAQENDKVILGGYPGGLRKTLGIWIEETDALPPNRRNRMRIVAEGFTKTSYDCGMLFDSIHLEGAEALAVYEQEFYAGVPCATRYELAKGVSYYVGTDPELQFLEDLAERICTEKALQAPMEVPEGIECTRRYTDQNEIFYLINHTEEEKKVRFPEGMRCAWDDSLCAGEESLRPGDVQIVYRPLANTGRTE